MLKEPKSPQIKGPKESRKRVDSKRAPKSRAPQRVPQRRSAAYAHGVDVVKKLSRQAPPEVLEVWFSRMEEALADPGHLDSAQPVSGKPVSEQDAFIAALTGPASPDPMERVSLELSSLVRHFTYRRSLLEGSLTTSQVSALLHTSRQTPHDRVKGGSLLALSDNGVLRFPSWQFDASGPDGVIEGLPEVIRALDVSPFAQISWFVQPNRSLDGHTPLETLRAGDREAVLGAARAAGVR